MKVSYTLQSGSVISFDKSRDQLVSMLKTSEAIEASTKENQPDYMGIPRLDDLSLIAALKEAL